MPTWAISFTAISAQRRRWFLLGSTKMPGSIYAKSGATIREAILDIPDTATHTEHPSTSHKEWPKPPLPDGALAKTITCSGGVNNYHPSGVRPFSGRELACLQTFPCDYAFPTNSRTKLVRMIGNAVPPRLAKLVYREVIRSLKKTDGIENYSKRFS